MFCSYSTFEIKWGWSSNLLNGYLDFGSKKKYPQKKMERYYFKIPACRPNYMIWMLTKIAFYNWHFIAEKTKISKKCQDFLIATVHKSESIFQTTVIFLLRLHPCFSQVLWSISYSRIKYFGVFWDLLLLKFNLLPCTAGKWNSVTFLLNLLSQKNTFGLENGLEIGWF